MTTGAISHAKLQTNHHHQQTNIQFFILQTGCPSCRPTDSVKALKGKISHSVDLLTLSSPGGLPTLSLTTNSSWLPWGRVAMPLISPLMPVPQLWISLFSGKTHHHNDLEMVSQQWSSAERESLGLLRLVVTIFFLQFPRVLVRRLHIVVADLLEHFLQERLSHVNNTRLLPLLVLFIPGPSGYWHQRAHERHGNPRPR